MTLVIVVSSVIVQRVMSVILLAPQSQIWQVAATQQQALPGNDSTLTVQHQPGKNLIVHVSLLFFQKNYLNKYLTSHMTLLKSPN